MKILLPISILFLSAGFSPLAKGAAQHADAVTIANRPIVAEVVRAVELGQDVSGIEGVPSIRETTKTILEQLAGCAGALEREPTADKVIFRFPCKPPILQSDKSELVGVVLIFRFEAEELRDLDAYAVRVQPMSLNS